jgi:hypothetical protein
MKQPNLPKPNFKLQGPDGSRIANAGSQNLQTASRDQKLVDVPLPLAEYVGGRSIPYKKAPKK